MAHYTQHSFNLNVNPPLPKGTQVAVGTSAVSLQRFGFNMPIEISTASAFRQGANPAQLKTITVMAHFDTGASRTSIDDGLAQHLGLIPTGVGTIRTAAGPKTMNNYAVDVAFLNTQLHGLLNLQVGACDLGFDLAKNQANPNDITNFGVLIGRDIMSLWHITWHGPTSTVMISD